MNSSHVALKVFLSHVALKVCLSHIALSSSSLQLSLSGSVFRGEQLSCSTEGRLARLEKDGSLDGKNEGVTIWRCGCCQETSVSNSTLQLSLSGSVFRGGRTVTCSTEGRLARLEKDGLQDGKNEGVTIWRCGWCQNPTCPTLRYN